jgi:spore germination protein GerM
MKHSNLLIIVLVWLVSACAPKPATVSLTVYFTDMNRYAVGTEPYEQAVTRTLPQAGSLPEMVLTQLFLGPSPQEKAQGLEVVLSGTTGFSKLTVEDGIARVYLTGKCKSGGATYTISNLIFANLTQFPEIRWVKIYDENGETETPDGNTSSIPICLEP